MKKEIKKKHFLPKPEYPGGSKAMAAFISENLKYPEVSLTHKTEGTVVLKGEINHKGEVIHTKVISSLDPDCDQEAERVVRLLKFRVDKVRNMKISYFKTFQIHFKLPKQAALQIQYSLKQKSETNTPKAQEPSIVYQIPFPGK